MTAKAAPKQTQGELDVRTQFQQRGVLLVEQAKDWREDDRDGLSGAIEIICDMEEFIRDWLATVEEP